jgi:ribose/xylose/arabinose/galactoside ABC-type transport system permease subunit
MDNLLTKGNRILDRLKGVNGTFIIMIVYIIIIAIFKPVLLSATNIGNIIRSVAPVGIMGSAITLIMLTCNTDLSTGYMLSLLSCISCSLIDKNPFLAVIVPMLVGACCGCINGFFVGQVGINSFVTTLGMSYVYAAAAQHYTNSKYLAATSEGWIKFLGQGYVLKIIPFPIIIFAAVAALFSIILRKTVFGSQIYMVGSNPVSAHFSGINAKRTIWLTYTITGATVGLAGVVLATRSMAAQPLMGAGYEFEVLTAVALGGLNLAGGRGSVEGTVLGVIFVGILKNSFNILGLSSGLQYLVLGVILLIAVKAALNREGGM